MAKQFKLAENIDKYMKYMEFVKSSSPLTLRHYLLDLEQAFGGKSDNFSNSKMSLINSLSESELLAAARKAQSRWSTLSLSSRNRKAATLKSFFSWSFQEGLTTKNLAIQIVCPKVPKHLPHFISVDEIMALLQSYRQEDDSLAQLIDQALIVLIYGGGLRISEACAARWSDLDLHRRVLRVHGKGGKERQIVLPRLTIERLKKMKEKQSGDYLFGEKPLNTRTAYSIVRSRGVKAGLLKPLHPHALRHSFATHLLASGANLRTLQEMLGHESLQATEKYTHLGVDQLARTLDAFHPLGDKQQKTS